MAILSTWPASSPRWLALVQSDYPTMATALRPRMTDYIPHKPTMMQQAFLFLDCLEALYGGAAGGGKTDALLMAALQYVDVPGYNALLLRRTFADLALPGAIMDRAHDWLAPTAAEWNERDKTWTFPSGARLTFGYLAADSDRYRYQGTELAFCVAGGTPILMADGTWKEIDLVAVGDLVQTLEGPRPVLATHCPGIQPVAQVLTHFGTATVGARHRVLTSVYGWDTPLALLSRESIPSGSIAEASPGPRQAGDMLPWYLWSGRPPIPERAEQTIVEKVDPASVAWLSGGQIDYEVFDDEHGAMQRPPMWCGQLMLYTPTLRSIQPVLVGGGAHGDRHEALPLDFPNGYRSGLHCGDEQPRHFPGGGRYSIPQSDGVAKQTPLSWLGDGRASIPECSPQWYAHPYTMEPRPLVGGVHPSLACIVPAGAEEVFDLTVSLASHYIAYPGIIAQNCGFDELTQFNQEQYTYLFSRLRRLEGTTVPLRMRGATNPGGEGNGWVYERFLPDLTPEAIEHRLKTGRVFIPARLEDNPHIDQQSYRRGLAELDDITRRQLEEGLWVTDPSARPFLRDWWRTANRYDPERDRALLRGVVGRWHSWDTALKTGERNAYTALVVGEVTADYRLLIREVWQDKLLVPFLADAVRDRAAAGNRDGKLEKVVIEDQASGTGVVQTLGLGDAWLAGKMFAFRPGAYGDKAQRAQQAALWCKRGCVLLPHPGNHAPWLHDLEKQLFHFPDVEYKDMVDAFSQLIIYLENYLAAGWRARGGGE